jgi:hypothetical protein
MKKLNKLAQAIYEDSYDVESLIEGIVQQCGYFADLHSALGYEGLPSDYLKEMLLTEDKEDSNDTRILR